MDQSMLDIEEVSRSVSYQTGFCRVLVNLLAPGELILLNSHKEGSFYAVLTDSRAFPILSRNSCCFPVQVPFNIPKCVWHMFTLVFHFPVVGM